MKKILLFLSFLLMSIGVFGETLVYTLDGTVTGGTNGYDTESDITQSSKAWKVTGNTTMNPWRIGGKKISNVNRPIYTTFTFTDDISKATVETGTSNLDVVNSITLIVSSSQNGGGTVTSTIEKTSNLTSTTLTFERPNGKDWSGKYFSIVFNVSKSANSNAYIEFKNAKFYKTDSTPTPTTYTVTYDANGGTGTMTDDNEYSSGETVTVLENSFSKDNYHFTGWNTAAEGSGTPYEELSTFEIANNTTLYAQWEKEPEIFTLYSGDLVEGDYIIYYDGKAMNTTVSSNRLQYDEVTPNNGKIETSNQYIIWHIAQFEDTPYWTLYNETEDAYAASTDDYRQATIIDNVSDNAKWSVTVVGGETYEFINLARSSGENPRHNLLRNNGTYGFACYKEQGGSLTLYKKIDISDYVVTFKNNGTIHDLMYVSNGHLTSLPTNPSNILRCDESIVFVGWSEKDMSTTDVKPGDLFQTIKRAPIIDSDKTFYAVFANEEIEETRDGSFSFTIDVNDFKGGGYEKNNGEKLSIAESTNPLYPNDTAHVRWVSYQIEKNKGAMQWQKNYGYIYNTISLGTITAYNITSSAGSYTTYYGSSERPSSSTTIGNCYFKTEIDNTETGYTSKITVNFTKSITPKHYSNYTTYCIDTLQTEGDWNNSDNWKHGMVPEFNEAAMILKPVTVDTIHATAKYIVLHQHDTCLGRLTIGPNQGLEVQDTISVYNGTVYTPTTTNDLMLESSQSGNASLIFNNSNKCQATVQLYTKSKIVDSDTWNWQYIGTAMDSLSALYNYYGSYVYRWSNNKWEIVHNGDNMYAWVGYCITQPNQEGEWYSTTGTLVPTDDLDTTLTIAKNSFMVFANSWTAPIHINKFDKETNFKLDTANVYLFNTGYAYGGSEEYSGEGDEAGTHIVIPIKAAKYTGDSLISPQQGFFVTTGDNGGEITLDYKTLVRTNGTDSITAGPMRSPKRNLIGSDEPSVLKIFANGSLYRDRLVILEGEEFSEGFDNGWDGRKTSFGAIAPSIYVVNSDGSYDAVSAIPDYEGTLLGFKPGTDIAYSLTFEYNGHETLYLNDMSTQESTLIDNTSRYVFTSDGSDEVRFVISATPYSGVSTDIDNLSEQSSGVHKFLYNGHLYILKNNCIFNIEGSLIKR